MLDEEEQKILDKQLKNKPKKETRTNPQTGKKEERYEEDTEWVIS